MLRQHNGIMEESAFMPGLEEKVIERWYRSHPDVAV